MTIQPNQGQQEALAALLDFIASDDQCFVLKGKAGTGKTTVIGLLEEELHGLADLNIKLGLPKPQLLDFLFAATTNKAADALTKATGREAVTVHRAFGISMFTDFDAKPPKQVSFIPMKNKPLAPHIVVLDESSYIDEHLLNLILKAGSNCKLIFMGDTAQIPPVGSNETPVFNKGYPEYELTEVMRQSAGTGVFDLVSSVREAVEVTGVLKPFKRGADVVRLSQQDFNNAVYQEFLRPDWKASDSIIVAYTNKTVQMYNSELMALIKGRKEFKAGDMALVNKFVRSINGRGTLKTEETITLQGVRKTVRKYGDLSINGYLYKINGAEYFAPLNPKDKDALNEYGQRINKEEYILAAMENFIDLRPLFACTVNKSQGSTFSTVYIDLEDLARVRDRELRLRLLYVAVSRARSKLIFTGDLPL